MRANGQGGRTCIRYRAAAAFVGSQGRVRIGRSETTEETIAAAKHSEPMASRENATSPGVNEAKA